MLHLVSLLAVFMLRAAGSPAFCQAELASRGAACSQIPVEDATGFGGMGCVASLASSGSTSGNKMLSPDRLVALILRDVDSPPLSKDAEAYLNGADEKARAAWANQNGLTYVKLNSGTLLADEDALGILSLKRQAWAMALVEKGVTKIDLQSEGEEGRRTLAQLAYLRPQHDSAMRSAPLVADLSLEFHFSFQRSDGSTLQCTEPLKRDLSGPGKSARQTVPKSSSSLPAMKSAFPSLTLASKIREQFIGKMNPLEQAKLRREASQVIEKWTQEEFDKVILLRSLCLEKTPALLKKLMDQARFQGPIKVGSLPEGEKASVKTMLMLSGHSGEDMDSLSLYHGFLGARFGVRVTLPDGTEGNLAVVQNLAP